MMLDADVVAVSPSSVYRVLSDAGLMQTLTASHRSKGKGFDQPLRPHEHWHVDVSYINIAGTFYYLCSLLDGYSRFIVHWEIRESMTEADVETILQRARERFPDARPRIISDNGPQFIAKDFKEFIRICGMTHVRTSPYYPQSNGKIETVAQDPQGRVHPGQDAAVPGGRPADRGGVRGALQRGPPAQRDRLRHAGGQAGRPRPDRSSPSGTASWRPRASGGRAAREASRPAELIAASVIARVGRRAYDGGWPGRRIGLRGDTTRAPTRGPRPKEGGTMPPCLSLRDWHEGGKSTTSVRACTLPYLPTPVSPFHAEPSHSGESSKKASRICLLLFCCHNDKWRVCFAVFFDNPADGSGQNDPCDRAGDGERPSARSRERAPRRNEPNSDPRRPELIKRSHDYRRIINCATGCSSG